MTWTELDWPALDRLRDGFLHGGAAQGPYWQSESALASYDLTYGQRIAWKWDHVVHELRLRDWAPQARTILDWGCGSGIASRRVIEEFGADRFDSLHLWDHEPLAADYAARVAQAEFPQLNMTTVTPGFIHGDEPIGLLIISHVLNELSTEALTALRQVIERSDAVLWVEPGTSDVSRSLGAVRDAVKEHFHVVAPCTHQQSCPVLAEGNERDWCHFFAPPPAEIFANPDWVKFGQRAGIDLRSLPYSFLALDRRPLSTDAGLARILGRTHDFKPYVRFLNCDATGLEFVTLSKRNNKAFAKELTRTKRPLIYRWKRVEGVITDGVAHGVD